MSIPTTLISKRELAAYRADVKGSIFRQIRELFSNLKEGGLTQKQFASRIDMDEGQLSRRLRGEYDLQLETLSDLARGLECRIDVKLIPIAAPVAQRVAPASGAAKQIEILKLGPSTDSGTGQEPHNDNSPRVGILAS
jgi:transcriptional regulator with XRE-family HTH domain